MGNHGWSARHDEKDYRLMEISNPYENLDFRAAMPVVADFWFGPRAARSLTRQTMGLAPESVVMVTVAGLARREGHLVTLAALSKVSRAVRENLCWLVIGRIRDSDYADELKARIADSGCDVRLLGLATTEKIRDVYGASDLFCLTPAENRSGSARRYQRAYLEAAACGLPSIATPIVSAADTVIENETGRLVEPSVDAVAGAIAELTIDGIKRMSLGKRAWMRVREMNRTAYAASGELTLPNNIHVVSSREIVRGSSGAGGLK
jgi:glycosyltransferase involved in cell wall biosynthesis